MPAKKPPQLPHHKVKITPFIEAKNAKVKVFVVCPRCGIEQIKHTGPCETCGYLLPKE